MAFPNISDIVATTIENRSRKIADNVTKNNGLLTWLDAGGRVKTISGGYKILQELSFAANGNAGWYSGYDLLPVAAQDVLSAAEFEIKQAACPVIISGLEQLQNAGREQMIDLLEGRISVAESSMANLIAEGIYSDGTGAGGKEVTGLDLAVSVTPTVGAYGGIDPALWAFWANKYTAAGLDATTVDGAMNTMWASLVRGMDKPDLIVMDNDFWGIFVASLQSQQRFTGADSATRGFPTLKYMTADVLLDGGLGGYATTKTAYFLNTKYLHWRPHAARNMVPLSPNKRYAINQDAEVQILGWAGNLTCSGRQFQGRLVDNN
ncbi:MAG: 3-phosphoglycerate kinase [Acidithiobacillales bacterium SM23_46]|nr:MAG: 3-phosphoglycerate kinase [Acidithiobacillales bacterium SM23_46]